MPNCFWPFAGRCFCVNYNCEIRGDELTSSYEKVVPGGHQASKLMCWASSSSSSLHLPSRLGSLAKWRVHLGLVCSSTTTSRLPDTSRDSTWYARSRTSKGSRCFAAWTTTTTTSTSIVRRWYATCYGHSPLFPLRRKYCQANFTIEGLERKFAEDDCEPVDRFDAEPPYLEQTELDKASDIVEFNEEGFGYEDLHKVISNGHIVQVDPLTGKWRRRPAGVSKDLWDRYPSIRARLIAEHKLELEPPAPDAEVSDVNVTDTVTPTDASTHSTTVLGVMISGE